MLADSLQQVIESVRSIYAELSTRVIERNCINRTECCQFRITGATPYLTLGEAIVAAQGLKASGKKQLPSRPDGACPLLKPDGKCMIYQDRPFGCRTHFCQAAGGMYPRREVIDLIHRLEAIDAGNGGQGPIPIQKAIQSALNLAGTRRTNRSR